MNWRLPSSRMREEMELVGHRYPQVLAQRWRKPPRESADPSVDTPFRSYELAVVVGEVRQCRLASHGNTYA